MKISKALKNWYETGKTTCFKGHRVFYQDSGVGDNVLLLIHGFPTAGWDWHHVWENLKGQYRLVSIDMLGFGFSDKPRSYSFSIHAQADLIEFVLAELGLNKVHVLAHDYGDTVAQELAARYLQQSEGSLKIETMTLLNGGLFPEQHRARLIQKLLVSPLGPLLSSLATRRTFESNLNAVFGSETKLNSAEMADLWHLFSFHRGHRKSHIMLHYIADRVAHRARWVGALQSLDVPLLLINGTADPVSGGHMADHYESLIPDPNVIRLEGIGHYPQLEAPTDVIEHVSSFIQTNRDLA